MRKSIFIVFVGLLPLSGFSQSVCTDSWTGEDKWKHAVLSAWLTMAGSLVMTENIHQKQIRIPVSGLSVAALGISKEWVDGQHPDNHFCWKDLTANLTGILLSAAVLSL